MAEDAFDGTQLASLYLSVTDYCNLACDYCSADAGPDRERKLDLPLALAAVSEWLQGLRVPAARLVFTGGEAVFWGYERLDAVCEQARALAASLGIRLQIGIQSNGTVASDKFMAFCERWQVEPSFSLDGTPNLSNAHRQMGEKVFANLQRLQQRGIPFALIVCLTREVADDIEAVLDFLQASGLRKFRINILGQPPGQRTPSGIRAGDILRVKQALYARLQQPGGVAEYNVARQVRWFDQALRGQTPSKGHCEQHECQAGGKTAVLNPDGRWGLCVEKSMTDGLPLFDSRAAMAEGAARFWQGVQPWGECAACPAASVCDHGCIAYHKADHKVFEEECHANQAFWKFLVQTRLLHQEPAAAPIAAQRRGTLLQPLMPLR